MMITTQNNEVKENLVNFLDRHDSLMKGKMNRLIKSNSENHNEIKELIGGESAIFEVELKEKVDIENIDINCLYENLEDIECFAPLEDYYKKYKLKREDLKNPYIGKIKTTKHLSSFFNTHHNFKNYIQPAISRLGEVYDSAKIKDGKYQVSIDTSPMAFTQLGHYRVDNGSCFACTQGSNEESKYKLGGRANTFVMLISEKQLKFQDSGEVSEDTPIYARAIGFFNPKDEAINIFNVYTNNGDHGIDIDRLSMGNIMAVCKTLSSGLLKKDLRCLHNRIFTRTIVYINEAPLWSFVPQNTDKLPAQYL